MARYKYLILPENGDVWGTNDLEEAVKAAQDDLVIDVESAEMLDGDNNREQIDRYDPPEDPTEELDFEGLDE